jgi:hypothetical protein
MYHSEQRIKRFGGGCVIRTSKDGCKTKTFNGPSKYPNFLVLWKSLQRNFPNHDVHLLEDFTQSMTIITIVAKDDFSYDPQDIDFINLNKEINPRLCKIFGKFLIYYLPPFFWKKHLGIRSFKSAEACSNDAVSVNLMLIYPNENYY